MGYISVAGTGVPGLKRRMRTMAVHEYTSLSPEDTKELGRKIGERLGGGEIVLLHGDLGAGKTLFTKGLALGLGAGTGTAVVSPTFTLVNIYKARLDIVHVDLYRLDSDEIFELGLEDYLDREHVMVVEWAEKARDFFSGAVIDVTFSYTGETSRRIVVDTGGLTLDIPPAGQSGT
jgi:tRNA threonylcarbamoyladenosine biosynthesis protein TsaE